MDATEERTTLKVIKVIVNPDVCHNGTCTLPKRQDVLGPYCSWLCRNEDKRCNN